jgi:predicted permease
MMTTLREDLRYAFRTLGRKPSVTAIAVFSAALGIGANATVFSVANGFLSRPIAAAHAEELVYVYRGRHSPLPVELYDYLRDRATSLAGIVAERTLAVGFADGPNESERVQAALISSNYFATLGVRPAAGRLFAGSGADTRAGEAAVVLSHRFWRTRFASDPGIIGRQIRLNSHPFTVVGVAEEGFQSSVLLWRPDVFLSFSNVGSLTGMRPDAWQQASVYITARLAPGTPIDRARAELSRLALDRQRANAQDTARNAQETIRVEPARGVTEELRQPATAVAGLLMAVVILVLLIACANVANLLLARGADRRREISIRMALGASRSRLVRMLLTESIVLAFLGGAAAFLFSVWTTRLMKGLVPADVVVEINIGPNTTVLLFTIGLCLITGVLFGLIPALRASSSSVAAAIKEDAHARGWHRSRLRSGFVMVQVALSLVLLVGSTLFLRSLLNARTIDPGFDIEHVLDLRTDVGLVQYSQQRGEAFYERLLERVRQLPGVRNASYAQLVPLEGSNIEQGVWTEGAAMAANNRPPMAYFNVVGPDYFKTLDIGIVRGREFERTDRMESEGVVVINESMARRLWPGADPLGKRISTQGPSGPWQRVVGVARDAKYNTIGEEPQTFCYQSILQNYSAERVLHVRVDGDRSAAVRGISAMVRELEPSLPPSSVKAIRDDMTLAFVPARAGAIVLGTFGMLALLLAVIGIYGVTSYAVASRTREMGIRAALGAGSSNLLRLVMYQSMRLVVIGALVGGVVAVAAWRLVSSLLYGVTSSDVATLATATIVLGSVALVASYIPARRAARVSPLEALRL